MTRGRPGVIWSKSAPKTMIFAPLKCRQRGRRNPNAVSGDYVDDIGPRPAFPQSPARAGALFDGQMTARVARVGHFFRQLELVIWPLVPDC